MRVAYVTGEYPRATDTFIQREVAGLRARGIEVETFSVRKPGDEQIVGIEQAQERQRTTYLLPTNPLTLLKSHCRLLARSPKNYLKGCKLAWESRQQTGFQGILYQLFYFAEAGILAYQLNQSQTQHLHNHFGSSSGSVAMLAAELGGFSYSFTLHGSYIFFEPYRWRLDTKIEKALFVSCISHFCRSQGMMFAAPEHWSKMHVIHCGIDPNLFQQVMPAGQAAQLNSVREDPAQGNPAQGNPVYDARSDLSHQLDSEAKPGENLLYVGRLAAGKGLPMLFESLVALKSSHPNCRLTVVGDGPDRHNLETLVDAMALGDRVTFAGYQSQSDVRRYLTQVDIFILPSFSEGVPVVLMEAMAAGVPVIATRVGGIGELVDDGINGYLAIPGDSQSLTQHLDTLLKDPQRRAEFGAKGRDKVAQEFNIYSEVERLYKVLKAAKAGTSEAIRPHLDTP